MENVLSRPQTGHMIHASMHGSPDIQVPLSQQRLAEARREFGTRLRLLREQRAWSQDDAGRRAGMSQTEWSRVERAETNPSMTTLLRMQHALGVDSIESMFGEQPSRQIVR
jgi:ribosome-binding protein aMBF1 (putative translation factor)